MWLRVTDDERLSATAFSTVEVRSVAVWVTAGLSDVADAITALGDTEVLSSGVVDSLTTKTDSAGTAVAAGNTGAAKNKIDAAFNQLLGCRRPAS